MLKNGKRYCSSCNIQVTVDAENCPSCKNNLFSKRRPQWLSWLIAVPLGFLMGIIVATVIILILRLLLGNQSQPLASLAGFVAVGFMLVAIGMIRRIFLSCRDLSVWKNE